MYSRKLLILCVMVTALIVGGYTHYSERLKCAGARQRTSQANVDLNRSASDFEAVTLADAYVYAAKNTGGGLTIEKEVGASWVRKALRHDLENIDFSILIKNNSVDGILLAGWSGKFGAGNATYMPVIQGSVYPFDNDRKRAVEMRKLMFAVEMAWNECELRSD